MIPELSTNTELLLFYIIFVVVVYLPPIKVGLWPALYGAAIHFGTAYALYYIGWVTGPIGWVLWPAAAWFFILWVFVYYDDISRNKPKTSGYKQPKTSSPWLYTPKPWIQPYYPPMEVVPTPQEKAWDKLNLMVKEAKKTNRQAS